MGIKDEVTKVETEAKALETKIEVWFVKHFHGSKIAGDTDSYNIAHAAKEDLKKILAPTAPVASAPASTAGDTKQ
jgi:hypothetical protein